MAKVNAKYEALYIIHPSLSEEETAAVVAKFTELVEKHADADSVTVEEWGKRRLAYEIDDQAEGYYVLMNFISKPDFPAELDRVFKITDGLMRSLIICKDE